MTATSPPSSDTHHYHLHLHAVEDFSPEVLNVTFEPSGGNDVDYVFVHIINDDLFEQDEEFVLVLEVFTDESDVSVSRSVSVGRISDDPNDSKCIT